MADHTGLLGALSPKKYGRENLEGPVQGTQEADRMGTELTLLLCGLG